MSVVFFMGVVDLKSKRQKQKIILVKISSKLI